MKKNRKNISCITCGKKMLTKDEIGINIKLLGEGIEHYYCIDCLANYLEVTADELMEKIEDFKEEGCTLFN